MTRDDLLELFRVAPILGLDALDILTEVCLRFEIDVWDVFLNQLEAAR